MTGRLFSRLSKPWDRIAKLALTATALLVGVSLSQAQQPDVSQELQLFNGLPQSQQQAILQQLGAGGGLGGGLGSLLGGGGLGGGGSLLGGTAGNPAQAMLLQQQLQQLQRRQQGQGQQGSFNAALKPGDTVLVDITVPTPQPESPSAPSQTQTQSVSPAAAAQAASAAGISLSPAQLTQLQQLTSQNATPNGTEAPPSSVEGLTPIVQQRLQDLAALIRAHNPYRLDNVGQLLLPGIAPIALAGLSEDLATRRVRAEPAFEHLQVRLTRLPLDKSGAEALEPFGYALFENSLTSFLPALNVPVSGDYIMGPGDLLQVQLYGNQNRTLPLPVSRDGRVDFPQIGPINVAGRRYSEVKSSIEAQVARQMTGTRASVSIVETRTINVFVLGAAKYPGSYTITGQATVTTAIFAAGGVERNGSLRKIQVRRQGAMVRDVDLYDLLMRGDNSSDVKLEAGDVVFIPPLGNTVSLDGEVLRPAIYEIKGMENVADLIRMGGGLTPDGDRESAALIRVDDQQRRVVLEVNPSSASLTLRNGDELRVPRLLPELISDVSLQGYVYRPRVFAWHPGLRLSEVIPSIDELKPQADQHYLLVRRELPPDRRIAVFSADLAAALKAPGSAQDILLMPRDTVRVFDLQNSRQYVIRPLLDELKVQGDLAQPTEIVHIEGQVKVPGDYPLEPGMRISDLIRAGGSLASSAYAGRGELSRYTVVDGDQRRTQVLAIDLNAVRRGDPQADILLQPFDQLSVKQVSGWMEQAQVTLSGEVRFPGTYAIKRGETLRSVIERAGGLTDLAFPAGAVFTREELKRQEQEQLDRLAQRMRTDIAEMALMGTRAGLAGSEAAIGIGQAILNQLQAAKAVGRLVINLQGVIHAAPGSSSDLILRDGDELVVPKERQDVMVLGEVQDATSHVYHPGLARDDYIEQSGGLTRQADSSQIYVVHADGSIVTGNRGWFKAGGAVRIRPGDAIVVPLDTVKLPALTVWQQSTAILYNLAIAVAAVHAL